MNNAPRFRLAKNDWINSILTSVIVGVGLALISLLVKAVTTPQFDVFTTDWVGLGRSMINAGFITFIVTLGQALLMDQKGNVLGSKILGKIL